MLRSQRNGGFTDTGRGRCDPPGHVAALITVRHGVRARVVPSATSEQAQGIAQVDVAVNQLDQTTQQNAALVEQSAAAAASLQAQAGRLSAAIGAFRG